MSKRAQWVQKRGHRALKVRQYAAAHAHYDKAIRLSPGEPIYYYNKGTVFFEESNFDDCIATCERALDVGPENGNLVAQILALIAKAKTAQEAIVGLESSSAKHQSPETDNLIADQPIRRRPLSGMYVPEFFHLLMDITDDDEAAERLRNLLNSSPVLSACFTDFMQNFVIAVRDHRFIHFFGPAGVMGSAAYAIYSKNLASFSWIAPFVVKLVICDIATDRQTVAEAYNLLPRTSGVLEAFLLWVPNYLADPPHPNVLPFVRRQLPNLQQLQGHPDFFLELPSNPTEPKAFRHVSLAVRKFAEISGLFESKRFSSPWIEFRFVEPPNGHFDFVSGFIAFLKATEIRFPETVRIGIVLPVLNVRFPATDLVNALSTVFPRLEVVVFDVALCASGEPTFYDYPQCASDYDFMVHQIQQMPSKVRVELNFKASVTLVVADLASLLVLVGTIPQGFIYTTNAMNQLYGIVNNQSELPLCHDNKFLKFELLYTML